MTTEEFNIPEETPQDSPAPTEEVTLSAPHTHAGRAYLSGEKMQVTTDVKQWLAEHGLIVLTKKK